MNSWTCPRCGTTAPSHFVACPKCHALFHAETLTALQREADQLEQQSDIIGALGKLRAMVPLLPEQSTQAAAIRKHIAELEPKAGQKPERQQPGGLLAGIGAALIAVLTKGKFILLGLTKLPTMVSLLVSAAVFKDASHGFGFVLVLFLGIYLHEIGHLFGFRRYGIATTPPMFVPGFGAFVRGSHYPTSRSASGDVALAGPMWGGIAGVLMLVVGFALSLPWLAAAALFTAELNLLNLIPVSMLDGGRAVQSLSKTQALMLGIIVVVAGAFAASPMGLVVGAVLISRRWLKPPDGDDRATLYRFMAVTLGLLALRFAANLLTADSHSQEFISRL